jgi:hypothetical protein
MSNGRIWPYAIGASIIMVFGFCVATVVVSQKRPVADSDTYMMSYHQADTDANSLIQSRIEFDKKYKVEYITESLSKENSIIKYRVTDLDSNPVNNANIKVVVTRPNSHENDQELQDPKVENGVYTFSAIELALPGRWDIMAKVNVGELERFYNVKADTRAKEAYEY